MRFSIGSLIVLLLSCSPIGAQSVEVARARTQALLALKQHAPPVAQPDCGCDICECPVCDCDGSQVLKAKAQACLSLCQRSRERGACLDDVSEAQLRAKKEGKSLFIWIGMTCHDEPEIRAAFPSVVHCHTEAMNGNETPRLLVGPLPNGEYMPFVRSKINPKTVSEIRTTLAPPPTIPEAAIPQAAIPQSLFQRGGCANGQCGNARGRR